MCFFPVFVFANRKCITVYLLNSTIRVRYLSVGQPYEGAVEVEANLEDAYLCLLKNMN